MCVSLGSHAMLNIKPCLTVLHIMSGIIIIPFGIWQWRYYLWSKQYLHHQIPKDWYSLTCQTCTLDQTFFSSVTFFIWMFIWARPVVAWHFLCGCLHGQHKVCLKKRHHATIKSHVIGLTCTHTNSRIHGLKMDKFFLYTSIFW